MPGKVIAVDVSDGQYVEEGQRLMMLEVMKTEHILIAPFAETVTQVSMSAGAQVEVEALLARIEVAEKT